VLSNLTEKVEKARLRLEEKKFNGMKETKKFFPFCDDSPQHSDQVRFNLSTDFDVIAQSKATRLFDVVLHKCFPHFASGKHVDRYQST
jgi:hypothetical protein